MEIIIPLPSGFSGNTYKELKNYLKQFELAIHYAQKSVENCEENGLLVTEDCYICFEHPSLGDDVKSDIYDELQSVELKINLQ